jgi:hypothetical protein
VCGHNRRGHCSQGERRAATQSGPGTPSQSQCIHLKQQDSFFLWLLLHIFPHARAAVDRAHRLQIKWLRRRCASGRRTLMWTCMRSAMLMLTSFCAKSAPPRALSLMPCAHASRTLPTQPSPWIFPPTPLRSPAPHANASSYALQPRVITSFADTHPAVSPILDHITILIAPSIPPSALLAHAVHLACNERSAYAKCRPFGARDASRWSTALILAATIDIYDSRLSTLHMKYATRLPCVVRVVHIMPSQDLTLLSSLQLSVLLTLSVHCSSDFGFSLVTKPVLAHTFI